MPNYKLNADVVKAELVTTDNIEQVALWCDGAIKGTSLPVHQRVIEFYTFDGQENTADIGDIIIKWLNGYCSKMSPDCFHELFTEVK